MNILQATNVLIEYFKEEDTFCFETNFESLKGIGEESEQCGIKAALLCALERMETNGIVCSSKLDKTAPPVRYWVIVRPFATFNQNLELDPTTALLISKIINSFSSASGNDLIQSDPTSINSEDIQNLCTIATMLIDEKG